MKYDFLGTVKTVGELVELLHENAVDENASITAAGAECHVMMGYDNKGNIIITFDDDDYSEEWSE